MSDIDTSGLSLAEKRAFALRELEASLEPIPALREAQVAAESAVIKAREDARQAETRAWHARKAFEKAWGWDE